MVGRHRSAILVGVAVAGLVLSACGSGSGSNSGGSGGSKSAYLVGATEDLSGALAVYGKWAQESLTGYFNYVNAHGGINGHQVTVKILDDASDPSRAATNVRQLTSEKALVVSGSTLSNICAAIEPMTTQAKVAEMCTAVPQNMFKPVHPYVFARLMPAETLADPIIAFVPKIITAPKPRVAIITTTAADAVAFGKRTQQEAEAQGWTVVANKQVVASENANITGPAAAIATAKADVVIGELAGPNNVTFIRQLRSAGSNAPFISETADYGSMVSLKDPGYYQAWQRNVVDPSDSSPDVKQFVAAMATVGLSGEAAINDGKIIEGYLAAATIAQGLQSCTDTCTSETVAKGMASGKVKLPGISDSWGFTTDSHLPVSQVSIYRTNTTNGTPELVQANLPVGALS